MLWEFNSEILNAVLEHHMALNELLGAFAVECWFLEGMLVIPVVFPADITGIACEVHRLWVGAVIYLNFHLPPAFLRKLFDAC